MIDQSKKQKNNIVPNVEAIAREMTGKSQVGIIISHFMALSLESKIKLTLNNLAFLPVLAKMDFAAGVKVLCELEILKQQEKSKKNCFVLHNQMVDMALALNNKRVLYYFFQLSRKYGFVPGVKTYNLAFLIKFLSNLTSMPRGLRIYSSIKGTDKAVLNYLKVSLLEVTEIE